MTRRPARVQAEDAAVAPDLRGAYSALLRRGCKKGHHVPVARVRAMQTFLWRLGSGRVKELAPSRDESAESKLFTAHQCAPGAHLSDIRRILSSYGIRGSYLHSSLGLSLTRRSIVAQRDSRPSAPLSALNSLPPTSPLQGALKEERSGQISYMHDVHYSKLWSAVEL
eukprot:scaffold65679_cov66-Phaeocystis_antarctica.AAC.2